MGYEEDKKRDLVTLEATWWIMDDEPGMDDLYDKAPELLDEMVKRLGTEIFRGLDDDKRLFLARFEFPKYGEGFRYSKGILTNMETAAGFIDFLAGFPIDCCEMLVVIGELSSKPEMVLALPADEDAPCAPVPEEFFEWPDPDKVLMNYTALSIEGRSQILANNLPGEPESSRLHWWFRTELKKTLVNSEGAPTGTPVKYPVPGEFLTLGVRMMPTKPWGSQRSSPFLYAGNWMDTVFYTSAVITAINEPTDDLPFPSYQVRWRDKTLDVRASDFAEYKVDDRVTIMKDVSTEKVSQLWKDDDMTEAGDDWQIVPITFYGLDKET